jgi:hypothetical protein
MEESPVSLLGTLVTATLSVLDVGIDEMLSVGGGVDNTTSKPVHNFGLLITREEKGTIVNDLVNCVVSCKVSW